MPKNWKKTNIGTVFKKVKKGDWGNFGLVCVTLISEEVMKQVETISKRIKDSEHGSIKRRSCLTKLVTF